MKDASGAAPAPGLTLAAPSPARASFRPDGAVLRGLASFGARHAPPFALRALPPFFGFAFALALPALRTRVRANLRRVLGVRPWARESAEVARTFIHFASCLTEALALARPSPPAVALELEGEGHLRRALEAKRGAILVTAHTGGWEIAGPLLAKQLGVEILVAMRREPNAPARVIQDRARARSGLKVVHIDGEPLAILPLFTHLRRGGLVGVQIDRAPDPTRTLPLDLFGTPGKIPSGPFELARAAGAAVIPVFARRIAFLRYEVKIYPPIQVPRRASSEELTQAGAAAVAAMQAFLAKHPTHWFDFGT